MDSESKLILAVLVCVADLHFKLVLFCVYMYLCAGRSKSICCFLYFTNDYIQIWIGVTRQLVTLQNDNNLLYLMACFQLNVYIWRFQRSHVVGYSEVEPGTL